jgi:hypothetical protein
LWQPQQATQGILSPATSSSFVIGADLATLALTFPHTSWPGLNSGEYGGRKKSSKDALLCYRQQIASPILPCGRDPHRHQKGFLFNAEVSRFKSHERQSPSRGIAPS